MLTFSEIAAHLEHITYRSGWTFTVQDTVEGPQLRIRCDLENSYEPGTMIPLGIDTYIPPCPDTGYLERWLLYRLARIETHECMEWLKRDGEIIFDPHAAPPSPPMNGLQWRPGSLTR